MRDGGLFGWISKTLEIYTLRDGGGFVDIFRFDGKLNAIGVHQRRIFAGSIDGVLACLHMAKTDRVGFFVGYLGRIGFEYLLVFLFLFKVSSPGVDIIIKFGIFLAECSISMKFAIELIFRVLVIIEREFWVCFFL